jgi:hypothetical protein
LFFTFEKNTIDRVESRRDVSGKDNCAAKKLIFKKVKYKKKSQEVILGIFC